MKELESEHLAPYLPYDTHMTIQFSEYNDMHEDGVYCLDAEILRWLNLTKDTVQLHLRPLSDLTKPITVEGYNNGKKFVPIVKLYGNSEAYFLDNLDDDEVIAQIKRLIWTQDLEYGTFQKLFEWHFDVFGLIEKGLAVDSNALKMTE